MTHSHEQPNPEAIAFQAATLWITVQRGTHGGRACRDHTVRDASGAPLFEARAFPWERRIVVRHAGRPDDVLMVLQRRMSFPFTGKVDVLVASGRSRLGVVQRNGELRDARGAIVGRFVDARTGRRRTTEALVEGLGNALVGGDVAVPGGSSATGYRYLRDGRLIGDLARRTVPFDLEPAAEPSRLLSGLARALPSGLRGTWLRASGTCRGNGWSFERPALRADEDSRLALAGALFMVELSYR